MCYAQLLLLLTPHIIILGWCKVLGTVVPGSGFSHNAMSVKQAHESACEQIDTVFNKYNGRQIMWMLFVTYHKSVPIPSLSTLEKVKNWTHGVFMNNWVEMAQDRVLWRTSVMMLINFQIPWQAGTGLIIRIHDSLFKKEHVPFIHSFIPLACAEFDDSLLFSGAPSIPLSYVLFPATLPHQLFFHPLSPHLAIYFLVYLSIFLFPNS